jgi:hypothetical protein
MKQFRGPMLALVVVVGLSQSSQADDNLYQDLLRRLPDSTNCIVVADVYALRKALGLEPGSSVSASSMTSVPIMARRFVMGSQVNTSQRQLVWSVALATHSRQVSIQDIAKAEKEPVDELEGFPIVTSRRNAYFSALGPDLLASTTPADRKQLKKWLGFQKGNQLPALPQYLLDAVNNNRSALVVMAIDLEDTLDPAAIRRALNASPTMQAQHNPDPDYDFTTKTLAHLKGVTFAIQPGSPLKGELTVDFGTNTNAVTYFAQPLLMEILQNTGFFVTDFNDWKLHQKYKYLQIGGPFSLNAFRKFSTLIMTPAPSPELDAANAPSESQRPLVASLRYYKSIDQILKDLKADTTKSYKGMARWFNTYADQIDNLPVLDVDPKLLEFATATTQRLRAMSVDLKSTASEVNYVRRNSIYGYSGYGVGYYAPGVSGRMAADIVVARGDKGRAQVWEEIDNAKQEIRKQMSLKYQAEF